MKKPFAIRVFARDTHGSTYERVYSRPAKSKQSKQAFTSFAIGDLLMLIAEGEFDALRQYYILDVVVLSPEQAYEFWMQDAEDAIVRQKKALADYVRDAFKMP